MPKKKPMPPRGGVTTTLRFKSEDQRDTIKGAAEKLDTSVNSFIRSTAEREARKVLSASLKDSNLAQD